MNIKHIADACKVTEVAIRNYEQGNRQLNAERLQDVANVLHVDPGAIKEHNIDTLNDVVHILFDLENAGLIQLEQLPVLEQDAYAPFCVRFNNEKLNEAVGEWFSSRDLWMNGQLSDDAYQNWKDAFPSVSANSQEQTENNSPVESADVTDSGSKAAKSDNPIRKHFLLFQSLESRFVSMTYAQEVPAELQERICSYVNCSAEYLNDRERIKFTPEAPNRAEGENDSDVLFDILDIMDKHTDSEQYRTIQIQLSRIVLYHIAQKGFLTKVLRAKEIPQQKTDYLFEGVKPRFNTMAFGYFYTELAVIREMTGMSYREMFTGIV